MTAPLVLHTPAIPGGWTKNKCPKCEGHGYRGEMPCSSCAGTGDEYRSEQPSRTVTVSVGESVMAACGNDDQCWWPHCKHNVGCKSLEEYAARIHAHLASKLEQAKGEGK